jgi:nitrite reductase/ring-hydroxylating ferredoxin subunit
VDETRLRLGSLASLAASGGAVVACPRPPPRRSILVVVDAEGPRAFYNVCRHLPVPLSIGAELPLEDGDLVCQTHGARFRTDDGACVEGPCEGDALEPVPVVVEDGVLWAELEP